MANRYDSSFDSSILAKTARRLVLVVIVAILVALAGCTSLTRVDAGHVGVKIKLAGSERGIQDMEVKVGWVLFNPLTEQVIIFPTSVQNVIWTASAHEGHAVDESITFSSSEGVNANADVSLSFHVEPALAPKLYGRFRENDLKALAFEYVRNTVREAFNEVTSKMPVQEIYGAGKTKMLNEVTQRCRDVLGKDGFVIDQLTINGALRLPQNVADAINRAMEATQNAIQSENRVRQVRAEADQAIAAANGAAEAARRKAQGDGDALLIRARSEAKANEIIRLSMSAPILQYRAIEHWDGKLPVYNAGDKLPLLTFDASKLAGGMDEGARAKRLKELLDEAGPAPTSSDKADAAPPPAQ